MIGEVNWRNWGSVHIQLLEIYFDNKMGGKIKKIIRIGLFWISKFVMVKHAYKAKNL